MKKLALLLFVTFIFINNVNAEETEIKLTEIKNKIILLKEKSKNLKENSLDKVYPIGSIYITTTYSSKEQLENNIGGTWEVYGSGKNLVGVDSNDSNFNTVNKTGGTSSISLETNNLPNHRHNIPVLSGKTSKAGSHYHNIQWNGNPVTITYESGNVKVLNIPKFQWVNATQGSGTWPKTNNIGAHTHTVTTTASNTGSQGSGTAFTNLQPYITVYMYKRVG